MTYCTMDMYTLSISDYVYILFCCILLPFSYAPSAKYIDEIVTTPKSEKTPKCIAGITIVQTHYDDVSPFFFSPHPASFRLGIFHAPPSFDRATLHRPHLLRKFFPSQSSPATPARLMPTEPHVCHSFIQRPTLKKCSKLTSYSHKSVTSRL